jgi:hypothetical protein
MVSLDHALIEPSLAHYEPREFLAAFCLVYGSKKGTSGSESHSHRCIDSPALKVSARSDDLLAVRIIMSLFWSMPNERLLFAGHGSL